MGIDAAANATIGGTTYDEGADAGSSVWVGTSAQPAGVAVAVADAAPMAMTVSPDQADLPADDTTANEYSSWS